jgi:drug/metabolite transporter (DMT)-like permease
MTKSVWLRLVALASLWGSEFLFIKYALRGTDSMEIVLVRLVLATGLLFVIASSKGERLPKDRGFYFHCAVLGLLATAAPYFLMAWAETRISSALTGILVGAGPLLTAALAALIIPAERFTTMRLAGLTTGLIGVILVVNPWQVDVSGDVLGSLAALGVALGFAIGYVYNVRYLTTHHASGPMIMSVQSLFGALYAAAWILSQWEFRFESSATVSASIVILGVFNTGIAAIVFFSLLRDAGAVVTSLVEYLMVIVAVALGIIFLDERLSLVTFIGVAFVIGGVALTERKKGSEESPVEPLP